MRRFDYKKEYSKLLTPNVVLLLTQIHEYKGRQSIFLEEKGSTLSQLVEIAKIQSTEASNKIEGIVTTSDRLKMLVSEKTMPKNRSEKEIAGYRDVLSTIHENYAYIPVKPSIILQLHRDLYKYAGDNTGGKYKSSDNVIKEEIPDGTSRVRFQPVASWETPQAIEALCAEFDQALNEEHMNPLIAVPMFILDFLCIHPFHDGNGRMSRLLTLLLLYRVDYTVGMYISIEKLISDHKDLYYEVLQESSENWHEGNNDYLPFVEYMLGMVIAAYRELEERINLVAAKGMSKPQKIRKTIKNNLGPITKTEIMEKCPNISHITVQRALAELMEKEEIIKLGGGRYTKYTWNYDKTD